MKINRQISVDGRKTERIDRIHRTLGLKSNFGGLFTGRYNGYKTSTVTPDGIEFVFHFTKKN